MKQFCIWVAVVTQSYTCDTLTQSSKCPLYRCWFPGFMDYGYVSMGELDGTRDISVLILQLPMNL